LVFVGGHLQNYLPAPVFAADIGFGVRWTVVTADNDNCPHNFDNCGEDKVGGSRLSGLWAPPIVNEGAAAGEGEGEGEGEGDTDVWGVSGHRVVRINVDQPYIQRDMVLQPNGEFGVVTLNAIWGNSIHDVWVVGDRGGTHQWDGQRWTERPVGDLVVSLKSVTGDGEHVWTVGGRNSIYLWAAGWANVGADSIDSGVVDEAGEPAAGVDVTSVSGVFAVPGSKDVWAVGAPRTILRWRWPD
jgi:hypothetical protein